MDSGTVPENGVRLVTLTYIVPDLNALKHIVINIISIYSEGTNIH